LAYERHKVVTASGRFGADGLRIARTANPADGKRGVLLIQKPGATGTALLAGKILLGTHLSSRPTIFRQARTIAVRSHPGMWFNVDGELVGNAPALFQIMPGALNFVTK